MDFYVVLGVRRDASDGDIRRAYKRLARQCHPDLNPGDREAAARFHDIAMAYETLTEPDRRVRYDRGEQLTLPSTAAAGFTGFDFSPRVHAEPSTTFGDLFAEVFAPLAEARQSRGADVHVEATVTLEDIALGTRRAVTVHRQAACDACAGTGAVRTAAVACGGRKPLCCVGLTTAARTQPPAKTARWPRAASERTMSVAKVFNSDSMTLV